MVKYNELIRAVNAKLKALYPNIRRYGVDTVDNAVTPYFFVECVPIGTRYDSLNFGLRRADMKITYVQRTPDQSGALKVFSETEEALGRLLYAGSRKLIIQDFTYDFVGENANILQMSFGLEWYENVNVPDTTPAAEDAEVSVVEESAGGNE